MDIIFDKLLWSIDFIYLCSCLVVDLGYSINSTVINETRRIFCKLRIGTNNSPSETIMKKDTFGEALNDAIEEEDVKAKYGIEIVVTEFINGKVNIESKAIDDISNTSEQIDRILTILKNNEVTPIGIEDAIVEIT